MAGLSLVLDYYTIGLIAIVIMAVAGALFYFVNYWSDIRSNFPELAVHKSAKKKSRPPIIDVVDTAGRHSVFVGDKKNSTSISFKNEARGVILDPSLYTQMPRDHLEDGTSKLTYFTNYHFPIDNMGAAALVQVTRKIRKDYPQLDIIGDDFRLIELIGKTADDLPHDVEIIMNLYLKDSDYCVSITSDMTEDEAIAVKQNTHAAKLYEMISIVGEIKTKMKTWGMESGFYSMADAMSKIPLALMVTDLQRAIVLAKIDDRNDFKQEDNNKWFPIMAICAIMGTLVMGYMVMK